MSSIRRKSRTIAVYMIILGAAAAWAAADTYELNWYTLDGGGGMNSLGGAYGVSGTIGQHDAGPAGGVMSGGSFTLAGGFWSLPQTTCTCPGDVNGDGYGDGRDVQYFVNCIVAGAGCGCADVNGANGVSIDDVAALATALLSGNTCP